jgi:hypothetical protein
MKTSPKFHRATGREMCARFLITRRNDLKLTRKQVEKVVGLKSGELYRYETDRVECGCSVWVSLVAYYKAEAKRQAEALEMAT